MPALRTEITEITTGLAMLGFVTLDRALEVRSASVVNVEQVHYEHLDAAYASGRFSREFDVAWRNGESFAHSPEGLRGRPPHLLEWKGGHRPPGYEQIPADLRIDRVYLVSCKYGSNILTNSSPANLFDLLLAGRDVASDWYLEVAHDAYQAFYEECRRYLDESALPGDVAGLGQEDRERLKRGVPRHLTGVMGAAYRTLADDVAAASAERWKERMDTRTKQEQMLWRILRLQSAPYFVLGESATGNELRYRVSTPWDFRNRYRFRSFDAWPDTNRRQPVVQWRAVVYDRETSSEVTVGGHVEIRWSHGRFAQVPEAKVYLDTPHHAVPGYVPLAPMLRPGDTLPLGWREP